ncbi:NupC/NupG family nucleoside CNT transporter [Candidatus Dependentiae bacterium]|nr:NupC/NupG family nucleoside CNT transporter [Candidatus Dependentiae bacterium]
MFLLSYLSEYNRYMNIIGIAVILGIACLFSRQRSAINVRQVMSALILHLLIALVALKTSIGRDILAYVARVVQCLYLIADESAAFIFGNLTQVGGPWGFVFAFKVLPVIIFFGAFMALLFHFGVIQRFVGVVSVAVRPFLGTSGAETLCAIANSFLGQTESPLLIRHYLAKMTKSEMLVVMLSGMATISGSILVVFGAMGVPVEHMLASSVMSIPAAILIAKIIYPEIEKPVTAGGARVEMQRTAHNAFDAIFAGTSDGLQLALNVAAMLISFLALLGLINFSLAYVGWRINDLLTYWHSPFLVPELSLQRIFAYLFAPFGYLLGLTGSEALMAGQLLGIKVAVNELIAYGEMVHMNLSARAIAIITYALCGFSNFSCIGIQLGGIGALVPEKRKWLAELGLTAVLGATLANLLSAMVAGLML